MFWNFLELFFVSSVGMEIVIVLIFFIMVFGGLKICIGLLLVNIIVRMLNIVL